MKKQILASVLSALAVCVYGISHVDFGRIEGQRSPTVAFAPSWLVVNGTTRGEALLTTNDYWNAGWRSLSDVRPATDEGHYAVAVGWEIRGDHWIDRSYEIRVKPPLPSRRIYKYDLSAACIEYGEITNLIAYISADVGIKWMWDAAEILVEDDEYFIAGTNEVIRSGLVAEDKVKQIINRAYELGKSDGVSR